MPTEQQTTTVQLGCGTLILIALIVLFFSNSGNRNANLETEVRQLRDQIGELKSSIDSQTREINDLKIKLSEQKNR
jgi:hypothetical protein